MVDKDEGEKYLDTVSDQERDLAKSALMEFRKKNYNACLQHLHKLETRTNDFKVALNKGVVEYCRNDFKKTDSFEKNLLSICNQFQIRLEKLDDVDHCIAHYNHAVLLFHRRQFTTALRIMDRVYKFIEPMDDTLAKQVSLLAIELQLSIKMPDKAMGLITYIESHLINGNPVIPNIKSVDKIVKEVEIKQVVIDPATEEFKKKLSKYKARCYLMKHQLSFARKEMQLISKEKSGIDGLFFAANIEYLRGNLLDAIKMLTSIPKDCLIYNDTGESSTVMFYNNMGVLHHAMGKPNLACHYFQNALKEDISSQNSKTDNADKPVHIIGGSKYHEIMFNLGIVLLHAGRTTQAFDCLIIAVRRYHRNSRLWMRIAECCIKIHKETNENDFDIAQRQKELVMDIVGSKDKQKYILTTNLSKDKKYSSESLSYAIPVPTLEFASICLRNAHLLIPSDTASTPAPLFLIPGVTPPAPTPSPGPAPSAPLSPEGIIILRNGILAASAYVSLCLGDYIMALEHARNLLSQPRIAPVQKLLGHLYAAESLLLLDKLTEAIEHLNPENVKDISFELTPENTKVPEEDIIRTNPRPEWFPDTLTSAHAVMQYNLAVAKTIRGQLDQAAALLKQVWQLRATNCKVPAHIIMLVIYIELQLGHADIARNLIKQYSFPHRSG